MDLEPRGEFSLDPTLQKRIAAATLAPAVVLIPLACWRLWPIDWWGWAIILPVLLLALSPSWIMGLSHLGRLRGNPTLVFSRRGIEIQRGGLWTILPFVSKPERDVIPWGAIRDVRPSGSGVYVDYDGHKPSRIRRLLGIETGKGELLFFASMLRDDSNPFELLAEWHEERLFAEIRADRLASSGRNKLH